MVRILLAIFALLLTVTPAARAEPEAPPKAELRRVPDGGIQPQVVVADGVVHLLYFKGDEKGGDLFYVTPEKPGAKPIRVNSTPGSAIAIGTIRGGQLAVGRNGRVHVAWNGANPRQQGMCYTRLVDDGKSFEPQRNLMTKSVGLDGGGTVAADENGHVYVLWHGADHERADDADRAVWLAVSDDDGKTFATERVVSFGPNVSSRPGVAAKSAGACACCSMKAYAEGNSLHVMYRIAAHGSERGMALLSSYDQAKSFDRVAIDYWRLNACPMSSSAMARIDGPFPLIAWENDGQVFTSKIGAPPGLSEKDSKIGYAYAYALMLTPMPGDAKNRKHPTIAIDDMNQTLVAWCEGTGWNKGGALAWQMFDRQNKPVAGAAGRVDGVPIWSFPAACWNGSFVIYY